ncbi:MAG: hypothetical protein V4739_13030 [Pseudomonadota bacterium]
MGINRLNNRSVRPSTSKGESGKSEAEVPPCVASIMVYLHHSLNHVDPTRVMLSQQWAEDTHHLAALSRALAGRRPWVDAAHLEVESDKSGPDWGASQEPVLRIGAKRKTDADKH